MSMKVIESNKYVLLVRFYVLTTIEKLMDLSTSVKQSHEVRRCNRISLF